MSELSLGQAISRFISHSPLKKNIESLVIKKEWAKLMGKTIASYTESIYISNQTLYIRTTSPALRNELAYSKARIISEINRLLQYEAINNVHIK